MTCVEKRPHGSHRNTMLHHRFPNGFTETFMDETDREVSILTDRAFRSLCIGDEAIYNDEFSHGYSPFSCHKPLVGEPLKKMKDTSKKHQIGGAKDTRPWEQQKSMSGMSLLKAFSVTENREGLLIKNGDTQDNNGDSWDKSALLSIERELSEFSSDFNNLATKKSGADANCSKTKNGKLRKLNIKNFFLHSEFSPFLSWRDFNRFPFVQEKIPSILPTVDNLPKWYDSPLYKELTEAHRMETMHAEGTEQQKPVKPPPPPPPPRLPPKVLPKPLAPEKRCASDTSSQGETSAPWRRNRARAKSALVVNQPGVIFHSTETPKIVEESHVAHKKFVKSVKVNELEESCSSTPFNICQLMTPIIPSRQATDTSEMTSVLLSPSLIDLPFLDLELVSPVKSRSTPEVVKRESYKSIAFSLLFNLKDNRKRVKSRYSPPKFKSEEADPCTPKLLEQPLKYAQAPSDATASGFSTPAILSDGLTIKSTVNVGQYVDSDLSDDYLISNLLQTKRDAAGIRSPGTHFTDSMVNKSHVNKKQTYPSLNLYKSPAEHELKLLSPNKGVSLNTPQSSTTSPSIRHSPNTSDKIKDQPTVQKEGISPKRSETPAKMILELNEQNNGEQPTLTGNHSDELRTVQNKVLSLSENTNQLTKDKVKLKELLISIENANTSEDTIITPQNKILFSNQSDNTNKLTKDGTDLNVKDTVQEVLRAGMEAISSTRNKILHSTEMILKTESPHVHSTNNILKTKSPLVKDENAMVGGDTHSIYSFSVPKSSYRQTEQQTTEEIGPMEKRLTNGFIESAAKEKESIVVKDEPVKRQGRFKHIFSARQNNYIKSQRCAMIENGEKRENKDEFEPVMVNNKKDISKVGLMEITDMKDSEQIISDLYALKELEKTRINERLIKGGENLKQKPEMDEEAKAKNNLISRELRNIKRGILSMRGNTFAKKEIFPNTEKEKSTYDAFLKIDNNVVINKTLINDNYDKAKMALEEIISDRAEKLKSKVFKQKEEDNKIVPDKDMERQNSVETAEEKQKNVRERIGDLGGHQLIQETLSQTETELCVNHRLGATMYAEQNKCEPICIMEDQEQGDISNVSDKNLRIIESSKQSVEDIDKSISGGVSAETSEDVPRNDELVTEKSQPAVPIIKPEVPPRGKKGNTKKEVSTENETGCLNLFAASDQDTNNRECWSRGSKYDNLPEEATGKVSNREVLDAKIKVDRQTDAFATENTSEHDKCVLNVDEELVQVNTDKLSPLSNNSGVNPSQQDQNSMSSKSSYFSVESSFHRNVETDSNIYHSLENLIAELEVEEDVGDVIERLRVDSQKRTELEYYSVSDHENEDIEDKPIVPPRRDKAISMMDNKEPRVKDTDQRGWVQSPVDSTSNKTATSQSTVFSPSLGKPSLFKVKDNTFSHHVSPVTKTVKPVLHKTNHDPVQSAPWSPRGSNCGSKMSEEDHISHLKESAETVSPSYIIITPEKQVKPSNISTHSTHSPLSPSELNPKHSQNHQGAPWSPRESLTGSEKGEDENFEHSEPHDAALTPDEPKETVSYTTQDFPMSPTQLTKENSPKDQQYGSFLTVPQADYKPPGVSPSSEGDTMDTTHATPEGSKVPSERSGSVCSGNDSQGLGRPPVVPPKSEKALLKAMKLTTKRIRKEEEKSKPHKSSGSKSCSGRSDPNNGKSSEQKSRRSDRSDKPHSSEKQHRERKDDSNHSSKKQEKSSEKHGHGEAGHQVSIRDNQNHGKAERQGRRTEQHNREKTEKRFLSSDRALCEHKRQSSERSPSERQVRVRAQSMDRHIGDKREIRIPSREAPSGDRPQPRSQRIEKSIRDGLSQRGQAQERSNREKPDNKKQSVDSYASEVIDLTSPHPNLSRQSSYNSQFSHQSSIDHGYTSFPMTQRKLLQDPDSGQYFVFDMPVQVKTKTFFDPETGNYVQLPIQPSEDSVTQVSTMEVMNGPRMIYHGSFVPVPVSTISSQNSVVLGSQMEKEHFEQKPEKQWYNHNNEGPPYLEPVYGSQDHMLGEFIGTEDHYDCMS